MTEFRAFLTSLYDSLSEAEVKALVRGRERLSELLTDGAIPEDVPLPVYHASDMEVTLNVRLEAEHSKDGMQVMMKPVEPEDPSGVTLTLDVFELLDRFDLPDEEETDDEYPDDSDRERKSVDVVQGIGPAYSTRLKEEGIETLEDLVELSPAGLADLVSGERIDISPERTAGWIEEARGLRAVLAEVEGEQPVEMVDGIGPTFGRRLRDNDIEYLSELVEYSPEAISEIVSTEEMTISAQQAAGWLEQAELVLESLENFDSRLSQSSNLDAIEQMSAEREAELQESSRAEQLEEQEEGVESDEMIDEEEEDDESENTHTDNETTD